MHNYYYHVRDRSLLIMLFFALAMLNVYSQPVMYCPVGLPAFDECEEIDCAVCDLNGYTGSTAGYGLDPDGDLAQFFCSTIESVQYVQFYAMVPNLSITVTVSNCTVLGGVDLGVMHGCDVPLSACTAGNGTNTTTVNVGPLMVGSTNVLIIDVDAAGPCDYTVSVNPPLGTIPVIPLNIDSISGDFTVCPNSTNIYEVVPSIPGVIYTWSVPPGAVVNGQNDNASSINITWANTGGNICIMATNPCTQVVNTLCESVTVTPIPHTVFPAVKICPEDTPYELPWGALVGSSGTFFHTIPSIKDCDSTLQQTVTILPPHLLTLNPVKLCAGDCVTICGVDYCDYGNYSVICQTIDGCDSIINFSIVDPNLVADILGSGNITCNNASVTLQSALSPGVKTWYDAAGQQIGAGSIVTVNSPGTYLLQVSLTLNGTTCSLFDSIVIPLNITPPAVTTSGAMIGCDTLPVFLHAFSNINSANYSWTGPNGFNSGLQNPLVTDTGTYILTVIDTLNGCSGMDTAFATLCCADFAGTLDSAALLVCGTKSVMASFHNDQNLGPNDSLVFILYTNPADPLGSILMVMQTPLFPFVAGMLFPNTTYYIASLAGPLLPDSTIDLHSACLSLSAAEPVMWVPKPTITLHSAPNEVCKGLCMDVTFQFTGVPPFQFHYNISQNGQPLLSQDETSNTLLKTITVCPAMFSQTPAPGALDFNVNFLQDQRCGCND